eukprot:11758984-Ditylum_brightwellii.AAC.1
MALGNTLGGQNGQVTDGTATATATTTKGMPRRLGRNRGRWTWGTWEQRGLSWRGKEKFNKSLAKQE